MIGKDTKSRRGPKPKKGRKPRAVCGKCGSVNVVKTHRNGRCLRCGHRGPADHFRGQNNFNELWDGRPRDGIGATHILPTKGSDDQ